MRRLCRRGPTRIEETSLLNSLERIRATLSGGVADRVPVFPLVHTSTARWAGVPISRYASDPVTMADCLVSAQQRAGYDGIHMSLNVTVEAEALGAAIEQPYDEPPRVLAPLLAEPADLLRLRVPDPLTDGRLPVFVEATRIIARDYGNSVRIAPFIRGPMVLASQLRGVEQFLIDLIEAPEFLTDLLAFCAEVGVTFAAALTRAGSHAVALGDALCSPASISPATYRRVAQPVHTEMVRRIHADGAGAVVMHVCGDTRPIIPDLVATGIDVLDVDSPVPLAEARALAGRDINLRGNVNPSWLYGASPADVKSAARQAIAEGGAPHDVLGTGCEVPIGTPIENLIALVEASREAELPRGRATQ
jgi:uroporphyrinogen decarboxylase